MYNGHHAKYEDLLNALYMKPIRFKLLERIQSKTPQTDIIGCVIEINKWSENLSHSISSYLSTSVMKR